VDTIKRTLPDITGGVRNARKLTQANAWKLTHLSR